MCADEAGGNCPGQPDEKRDEKMAMKTSCGKRVLTFGELVAATFDAMGRRKARGLLRFAANTRLIFFRGASPL